MMNEEFKSCIDNNNIKRTTDSTAETYHDESSHQLLPTRHASTSPCASEDGQATTTFAHLAAVLRLLGEGVFLAVERFGFRVAWLR